MNVLGISRGMSRNFLLEAGAKSEREVSGSGSKN